MDIIRDIAQLSDDAIRERLSYSPPTTVHGAFRELSALLLLPHGPVSHQGGYLSITIDGIIVTLRLSDDAAYLGVLSENNRLVEARIRTLPDLERLFTDSLATIRTIATHSNLSGDDHGR